MPRKTSSKSKKAAVKETPVAPVEKDGRGVHWYVLYWIIVITLIFAIICMVNAAWSYTFRLPQLRAERINVKTHERMENLERRMMLIENNLQKTQKALNEEIQAREAAEQAAKNSAETQE